MGNQLRRLDKFLVVQKYLVEVDGFGKIAFVEEYNLRNALSNLGVDWAEDEHYNPQWPHTLSWGKFHGENNPDIDVTVRLAPCENPPASLPKITWHWQLEQILQKKEVG